MQKNSKTYKNFVPKPPVPVEKWDGVLNATNDGPICPQPSTEPVSEDCLSLNVYSTKVIFKRIFKFVLI